MNNGEIAAALDQVADILEFQGANSFKVRAYRNGARIVQHLHEPAANLCNHPERKLTDIEGIGKDLCEKITTMVETGRLPLLEQLQAEVPHTVMQLLRIPGLGPKKAAALFKELNVTTADALRAACEAHQVRALKGFGEKTEQAILQALTTAPITDERMYWAEADTYAQLMLDHLRTCPAIEKMEMAGSYRRGRETVGDLDVLVVSSDANAVMDCFGSFAGVGEVLARGDTKMSVRLGRGLQIDLRVVPAESFGAALQYFTGSKEHNVILRGLAKDLGLKINEYGVYRGDEYVAGRTEEEVYAAINLPTFPPELREGRQEFEWAQSGALPKLVELSDLVGDLHMHTTETDGKGTLEEMVAAAQARGLKYIAITDHSQRVHMARGLDATRLRAQWAQIDALNARLNGFRVLKGIEVDILEKGGLDLEDDVLSEADWVVASLHYGQKQPGEQITDRILGAIRNPYVSVIAHPTGRLINRRQAYDVDLTAVYQAAREHKKFLELNANPARLDLDDLGCMNAKKYGIPIVISSDAHTVDGLDVQRYGILQARRAALTREDVVNTRPWEEIKQMMGRN